MFNFVQGQGQFRRAAEQSDSSRFFLHFFSLTKHNGMLSLPIGKEFVPILFTINLGLSRVLARIFSNIAR
jgi:hypothetical protein